MGAFISWIKKNMPEDNSTQGEARGAPPQSISGMISTLVPVLLISLVYILIFLFLRRSQRRFYAPRTYLGSLRDDERTPSMPSGWFNWIGAFWKIPDAHALTHQSLDAYLFIRYLRVCFIVCLVSAGITFTILFPVNATGGNNQSQLEILSYSNVNLDTHKNSLFAHAFVAWAVYGFLMYMITRECIFYINLRQAYLLNPQYAQRISARTVLFTSVPQEYLDEGRIRGMFNNSVKNVWICGDATKLDEMVEERDKVAMKLEKAEIKLLKTVNKARVKSLKKSGETQTEGPAATAHDTETGDIAARWITNKERPSHRLGPLGLFGEKVDTIEWGRAELNKLVPQVNNAQAEWRAGNYDKLQAVFVEFHSQSDAQAAYQVVTHHQALHMDPKAIGVKPTDIVWKNLNIPWWQVILRRYAVYLFIALLIIFWAIPVGIVGLIAQVNTLKKLPGMSWIDKIPKPILGVVSGLLPSVALSILMSLVPVIMRVLAKKAGCMTLSQAELFTQNAYFWFQLIQVFLIRTLADAASTAIIQIAQNPNSVFQILSVALPTSSNFYIAYFIVQGLTIAVGVVTQVVGFFVFKLFYKFLTGTPRGMYKKWTTLSAILWGSLLPVYTTIAVISIAYAVIAPIMLFWSTLAMGLFYLAYRYNILFVSETQVDTHGLIYPRALKQLFAGIYLGEICMIGLFSVSKAGGPVALMVVFLIFTLLYHITLTRTLNPLMHGLPRTLQVDGTTPQHAINGEDGLVSSLTNDSTNGQSGPLKKDSAETGKKPNMAVKFLQPWKHADYFTLRKLFYTDEHIPIPTQYSDQTEAEAFLPPSVASKTPILWIPQDPAGVSKQEVTLTSKVIPISDEGCTMDDKNKLSWDTETARPPIWDEKIYY